MERIGVAFAGGGMSPPEVVDCVKLAEELGYESAWVAEGHGGDQFSILTACALATSRIQLGTSISSVFVRSAPTIAMAAACVDHYSGGRFILGLGSSHKVQVEPEHGLEFSGAIPRVRDTVEIVRLLLRDGVLENYRGEAINIDTFDLHFPVFRAEMPIYLAAVFPKMLEIAGEISQGILLTWCTPEHARTAAQHVAIGAQRAGVNPDDVEVATLVGVAAPGADDGGMRRVAATYAGGFPRYRRLMSEAGFADEVEMVRRAWRQGNVADAEGLVPEGLIDRMSLPSDPVARKERLAEYREAGITLPIIAPRISGPNAFASAKKIIQANAPT
ncbi:MAG: LLM class flavin-dependent oxidoreductase [Dehalococcoidia bacterium]|nr:LLM class flavin-dependent oxidoreductase [Dehalococcoidia bacterium]